MRYLFPAVFLITSIAVAAQSLPSGVALPVMMGSTINSKKAKSDEMIEGKLMQEVRLKDGSVLKSGAHVYGHIISNEKTPDDGNKMVLRFDRIVSEKQTISLHAGLLAVASMASVANAELPVNGDNSPQNWITRQIGGDVVNRGRGIVKSSQGVIGKYLQSGEVIAKLTPNPQAGCPGGDGYDQEQSLWLFSSSACGPHSLKNLTIAQNGIATTPGIVTLASKQAIEIRGGSGWLLITTASGK